MYQEVATRLRVYTGKIYSDLFKAASSTTLKYQIYDEENKTKNIVSWYDKYRRNNIANQ